MAVAALPAGAFVSDEADLLTPEQEALIAKRLSFARTAYGPHMMVMTVKSLGGQTIDEYSLRMANHLGVGDAERDDGLLVLVAPNERKVRIEVGLGLEASFTDTFCARVIETAIVPQFKTENYPEGIIAAVDAMIAKMKAVPIIPVQGKVQKDAA